MNDCKGKTFINTLLHVLFKTLKRDGQHVEHLRNTMAHSYRLHFGPYQTSASLKTR